MSYTIFEHYGKPSKLSLYNIRTKDQRAALLEQDGILVIVTAPPSHGVIDELEEIAEKFRSVTFGREDDCNLEAPVIQIFVRGELHGEFGENDLGELEQTLEDLVLLHKRITGIVDAIFNFVYRFTCF
jgi:hypothetical protein